MKETVVKHIDRKMIYCTNCGNKLEDVMSEKCKYCGGIIVHESNNYILSKIQMLSQSVYNEKR